MQLAGIPENVAMEISGHRTRSVFDRYSNVGGRELADAAQKMEDRLKQSLAQSWAQPPNPSQIRLSPIIHDSSPND